MKLSICFTMDSVEFTPGVIAGTDSLGGSESSCVGLARSLRKRGHDVHIFATKVSKDAPRVDHAGVAWHAYETIRAWSLVKDWDVLVALRMPATLGNGIEAKLRVLWNQDLMHGEPMKQHVMGLAWAYDKVVYVSRYHQKQWEDLCPELTGIGWVTKNGFEPAYVPDPKTITKDPNRIIHISRPERGLEPLLTMWPLLKAARPQATLQLCRYSSMYDPTGWGEVCKSFDTAVAELNAQVGGIEYLGELGKPALYKAIAGAAVMWYPGVYDFAETSCVAAIESQACGTPFVGSYKGALPETAPYATLIKGNAQADAAYHQQAIAAVCAALDGCKNQSFGYRQAIQQGRQHVESYPYDVIAGEWEQWLDETFEARYEAQKAGVLRRLVFEDDLTTAKLVAAELGDTAVIEQADRVAAGLEHTATDYAARAMTPHAEIEGAGERHQAVVAAMKGCTTIVDIACGNGAFAILLAKADPARRITAIDYSAGNIEAAKAAAVEYGVAEQITFICAPAWDFATQQPSDWLASQLPSQFDGLWCGEFIEHVADCTGLVNALEALVKPGGTVVFSCPLGPLGTLAPRNEPIQKSHVHHFRPADLRAVFGQKADLELRPIIWNRASPTGHTVGNWLIGYRVTGAPTGVRPVDRRVLVRPYDRLSVGIIANHVLDIRRCLDGVWSSVDEIVIGNTGADPAELSQVLKEFPRKMRVVDVGHVHSLRGGFGEARNRVLDACTGEWFMWVDCDEQLIGAAELQKYTESVVFNGYSIPQVHLHLDAKTAQDTPVRLFRRLPSIQFYGCIHEQPQMGDANGDIVPCLQVNEIALAHTGYLHENIRRDKALHRNLPLLIRDQQVFPERELGKLLVIRDYANLALWELERHGGQLSPAAKEYYRCVVGHFEAKFMDPTHRFHALARPFYQQALRHVAGAFEVEVGMAGQPGGLGKNHAIPSRDWFRIPEHFRQALALKIDQMLEPLEAPKTMDVEPITLPPVAVDAPDGFVEVPA